MSDIQEKQEPTIPEMDTEPEVPLLKPKRKMKKFPRTEKQQEAFKITMQKRAENVEKRKQQKKLEAAKLLIESESLPSKPEPEPEPESEPKLNKHKKIKKKLILSTSDSETDSDSSSSGGGVEQIYVSRKSIKQPKKVYIIKREKNIIEEVDEDDEYENHRYPSEKPVVNKFKSQQNKKSVVKISNNIIPMKNYFCD